MFQPLTQPFFDWVDRTTTALEATGTDVSDKKKTRLFFSEIQSSL